MDLLQKKTRKHGKKLVLKQQKLSLPYCNVPVHTRDTALRVRGVSRSAKNQNRTRTRDTRFGNTAGKPVPVLNPIYGKNIQER